MRQSAPQPRDLKVPQDAYAIAVEGMSCQHCVAKVEQALRAVPGVTAVTVSLERGLAEVVGGRPHQAVQAVESAGYASRPLPNIPASCPVPEQPVVVPLDPTRAIAGGYLLAIEDMTCASCVATVERAIRAVAGVEDAAVNLVEKRAAVSGGDPQAVVDAVIDQGYNARLIETPVASDSLLCAISGAGAGSIPSLSSRSTARPASRPRRITGG